MISIRKFVGYAGAAAGISAAIVLAMSSQTGLAYAPSSHDSSQAVTTQATPSAACTAAIQVIKNAWIADRSEDATERALAKTDPGLTVDQTEDGTEFANFKALFGAARTACAPAVTSGGTTAEPNETRFTPSAQCTAAITALKAAWARGKPTTQAQWQALQSLFVAARSACEHR
jgi:hypothetical protein